MLSEPSKAGRRDGSSLVYAVALKVMVLPTGYAAASGRTVTLSGTVPPCGRSSMFAHTHSCCPAGTAHRFAGPAGSSSEAGIRPLAAQLSAVAGAVRDALGSTESGP